MIWKGTCHSELGERLSAKGDLYGSFYLQANSKIWKVLVFKEIVEYAKRHVRIDEKVVVDGKLSEKEEDPVILASSISFPAIVKERKWDIGTVTKGYREYVKAQETLNFVEWRDEYGQSRLTHKKYCISVDGKWLPAIEFAMNVYGPDTVKLMLEEMNWRVSTRDVINQITISAIIKYREDNPGAVSIIKGWEAEQVQGSTNTSERDLVPVKEGSSEVCRTPLDGEGGSNQGVGATEIL